MALLYAEFGNPLMPYFNNLFHSPYVPALGFSDPGFTDRLPWPRVQLPFIAGLVDHVAAEQAFTDLRLPFAYGAALLLLPAGACRPGPAPCPGDGGDPGALVGRLCHLSLCAGL